MSVFPLVILNTTTTTTNYYYYYTTTAAATTITTIATTTTTITTAANTATAAATTAAAAATTTTTTTTSTNIIIMRSVNFHAEAIDILTPTCQSGSLVSLSTCIMYTYFILLNYLLTSSTYLFRFIIVALLLSVNICL